MFDLVTIDPIDYTHTHTHTHTKVPKYIRWVL